MASAAYQDIDMSVRGKNLTLSNPPLTAIERTALDHCSAKAATGEPVTQMSLMQAIGSQNTTGGTSAGVLGRLEAKGYVERRIYQRGVQVCVVSTGKCTAPPSCTVPHWRSITDRVPTLAIHQIRERDINEARWVENEARSIGQPISEFLQEITKRGIQDYKAEKACAL